jgi:hypothetical protein
MLETEWEGRSYCCMYLLPLVFLAGDLTVVSLLNCTYVAHGGASIEYIKLVVVLSKCWWLLAIKLS